MTGPPPPRYFVYRTPLLTLAGVSFSWLFPAIAGVLVLAGVVALLRGTPVEPGAVAVSAAFFLGAGALGLWSLFRCGYKLEVDGTTLTWRAPLARATVDLAEKPLDVWGAANSFGPVCILRFGDDTNVVKLAVDGWGREFDAFLEDVRRVQAATSQPSP